MSSRVEPLLPPLLSSYGSDYQSYVTSYLFYLRWALRLKRDVVATKVVKRIRTKRPSDKRVVFSYMTIDDLYERFQPVARVHMDAGIGNNKDKRDLQVLGHTPVVVEHSAISLSANAPAPVLQLAPAHDDASASAEEVICGAIVNERLAERRGVVQPTVKLEYVNMSKNEIYAKFSELGVSVFAFKRMWDAAPRLREGHPVYVLAQFEVARCQLNRIDPRKDVAALAAMETWNKLGI